MIKIAVPNKGSLSEMAVKILSEAGYKSRGMTKALNIVDEANGVEFFFLRPKDIAIYVAKGLLDLGITGRDLAADSRVNLIENERSHRVTARKHAFYCKHNARHLAARGDFRQRLWRIARICAD